MFHNNGIKTVSKDITVMELKQLFKDDTKKVPQ